jgi:hypothetical protein
MENTGTFALRRTIQPYAALLIIWVVISLGILFAAFKSRDLSGLLAIIVLWALGIWSQYPNTRYQIVWHNEGIKQTDSTNRVTTIKVTDIKEIVQERSDLQTLLAMRRPSRRIAIYADASDGRKWIDVSLKHFAADDVRRLMRAIHERRPDLSIPKCWI